MAKVLIGGRPSKAALGRMKVVTIAVSIAAFLGSLGVIAANGTGGATVANTHDQSSQVAFAGSTSATQRRNAGQFSAQQQPGFSAPLTRSRGS